jgi:hypothetical protein
MRLRQASTRLRRIQTTAANGMLDLLNYNYRLLSHNISTFIINRQDSRGVLHGLHSEDSNRDELSRHRNETSLSTVGAQALLYYCTLAK